MRIRVLCAILSRVFFLLRRFQKLPFSAGIPAPSCEADFRGVEVLSATAIWVCERELPGVPPLRSHRLFPLQASPRLDPAATPLPTEATLLLFLKSS